MKIADVTGFSVARGGKLLERQLNVLGNGTLLGTATVNHGTAEAIERWFRSHPQFGANTPTTAPAAAGPAVSVADEIQKLAQLHADGVLTEDEFAAAKQRLIAGGE